MPDISDTIETVAAEPAEATVDGQSAKNQPIPDLIAADKHISAKTALEGTNANGGSKSMWGKVRMARGITGGPAPQ
jgi:hypothetical protein